MTNPVLKRVRTRAVSRGAVKKMPGIALEQPATPAQGNRAGQALR